METIQKSPITLKLIFQENWNSFLANHRALVTWYMAYNVWKIMNCREPGGLGFSTFVCPVHSCEIRQVPHSCKSRFCSVCAKVQIDEWVADMNRHFPCVLIFMSLSLRSLNSGLCFLRNESY